MKAKLTKDLVKRLEPDPERDLLVWDTRQTGFGLRITRKGAKSWIFNYTPPGRRWPRRVTIGPVGAFTLDQARKKAEELRGAVAKGEDPARKKQERIQAPTVRELRDRFINEHGSKRAPYTQRDYLNHWDRHLLPHLGEQTKVRDVTWEDLEALHRSMSDTPTHANRVLTTASKSWAMAARWGWWPRNVPNPARDHDRYPERPKGRAMERHQLRAIGKALEQEPPGSTPAAALAVLMLTGLRPGECLKLRWEDLEGRLIHLPEAKTGPRTAYLGAPAAKIIEALPRLGPYVFAGRDISKPLFDINGVWRRVRARADLPPGTRIYDVTRHTFTTYAEEIGIPEDRRRRLVGHALRGVHARYTHPRHELLLADADRVAGEIWAAMMAGKPSTASSLPYRLR